MNRNQTPRGQPRRNRGDATEQGRLERRRAEMHAAEGHAGSIPRGNQDPEHEPLGQRRREWDRVLGH